MEKESIIDKLSQLKFTVIDKVYIEDDDEPKIEYLKSYDPIGNIVFINIDSDINLDVNEEILAYNKIYKASIVPQSVKMGLNECMSKNICGVMICTNRGLCALKHENNKPQEENLIFSSYSGKPIVIANNFEAYPITNYSDIINNYQETLNEIKLTSQRIKNSLYVLLLNNTNDLLKYSTEYDKNINIFTETVIDTAKQIANALSTLENAYNSYENKDNENVSKIIYNIQTRNVMLDKIFGIWNDVNNFSAKIKNELEKLESYTGKVNELKSKINNVYNP